MPAERYHFAYAEDSPYGHIVALLRAHTYVEGGLVLDLGCGYGAIAEPVAELGLTYVGLDLEPGGIEDLARRGFEGALIDLGDPKALQLELTELIAERPLAGLCALDVIEHLTNGAAILSMLHELSVAHGRVPLFVSIPNVAHLDLGAKLLTGRWDVTPTGLLDETHVSLYGPARLKAVFEASGWCEIGEADFELVASDQHFPADSPVLAPTPLHGFLAELRSRAAPAATTNQFVRAYAPVALVEATKVTEKKSVLVSILLDDVGRELTHLEDALVALEAQLCSDFEILLILDDAADRDGVEHLLERFRGGIAERTRVLGRRGAVDGSDDAFTRRAVRLDEAIALSSGRYIAVLDVRCSAFSSYVATFARLEAEHPGAVLRCLGATQAVAPTSWPRGRVGFEPTAGATPAGAAPFSLLAQIFDDAIPRETVALPRTCFSELGQCFEPSLGPLMHQDALVRSTLFCGLAEDLGQVAVVRRVVESEECKNGGEERARRALEARLDRCAVLLPPGSLATLRSLYENGKARLERLSPHEEAQVENEHGLSKEGFALLRERDELCAELVALRASTSWKLTAPLRALTRSWRAR